MILLTVYLAIGSVFATFMFCTMTAYNRWGDMREYFEERFPEVNFRMIITFVYIAYIIVWPIYLLMYIKKI